AVENTLLIAERCTGEKLKTAKRAPQGRPEPPGGYPHRLPDSATHQPLRSALPHPSTLSASDPPSRAGRNEAGGTPPVILSQARWNEAGGTPPVILSQARWNEAGGTPPVILSQAGRNEAGGTPSVILSRAGWREGG